MKKYKSNTWLSIYDFIATRNYIKAMKNQNFEYIRDLIEGCEFEIEINPDGSINLIDLQWAYLGGVESYENFNDIFSACERLEGSFLRDYYNIYV